MDGVTFPGKPPLHPTNEDFFNEFAERHLGRLLLRKGSIQSDGADIVPGELPLFKLSSGGRSAVSSLDHSAAFKI